MATTSCGRIEAYDNLNGSVALSWPAFGGAAPDSYNVYVNGVLNQNVVPRQATVAGLTPASYSPGAIAAPSGNSARPQNMPPTGVATPSGTYVFKITAVKAGVEVATSDAKTVTVSPPSIALVTPMKRLWPFPNTGLD